MAMSAERAALYEKYRPPYSKQAISELLKNIGKIDVFADVGAGTGQLSRLFAPHCHHGYAIEPDHGMRTVGEMALKHLSNLTFINGSAEHTTLPDQSVDALAIGNAFHRFKPEACNELHRILKPEGWIILVSYEYLNRDFTDMLFSKLATVNSVATKSKKVWHRVPQENLVGNTERPSKTYKQTAKVDWEQFWGAAQAGIESPEQDENSFAQFEAVNREVFDHFAIDGIFSIDYATHISWGPKPS